MNEFLTQIDIINHMLMLAKKFLSDSSKPVWELFVLRYIFPRWHQIDRFQSGLVEIVNDRVFSLNQSIDNVQLLIITFH